MELVDGVARHHARGTADEGDDLRLVHDAGGPDFDVIVGEKVLKIFPIPLLPRHPRLALGGGELLLERVGTYGCARVRSRGAR